MRIAYIAPYQGPGLLSRRPTLLNLGLAANVKMELVAELLQRKLHTVEVLSQGAVVERRLRRYPAFREPKPFDPTIPVFYASALPIRRVNGLWSAFWTLQLFRRRHRQSAFDAVLIYNLQLPQVLCALYAMRRFGLPVVLEYEDDAFVDVGGIRQNSWSDRGHRRLARAVLSSVSGCTGVSPHILSQVPAVVPKALLRGVVSANVLEASGVPASARKDWVVFSGTHFRSKGLEQLVKAWDLVSLPNWELHIAGHGEKTDMLRKMAQGNTSIVFHGLLNREQNARLLSMAKIGANPHDVSAIPGNVFAFKIIEYLAAGTHVVTTPMGALESELEAGLTYMPDNSPETIAATLRRVVGERAYERTARQAAQQLYGPEAVAKSLDALLNQARTGAVAHV
ncbi:MAG: hypothetical protein DMD96_31185 [Candidatus Rokuibacteriota bacterium]|nr:MAG: hypothetical protein DMD96_31185 [Candidatus Rokubacteria bacterium]